MTEAMIERPMPELDDQFLKDLLGLSLRQYGILEFIAEFAEANHGYSPTSREIAKKVGIPSTSVVNYNLDRLEQKGFIECLRDLNGRRRAGSLRLASTDSER